MIGPNINIMPRIEMTLVSGYPGADDSAATGEWRVSVTQPACGFMRGDANVKRQDAMDRSLRFRRRCH